MENSFQLESSKRKAKQTKVERYGNPNFVNTEKAKKTKLERYGDSNYTNREKSEQTCLDKYGVKTFTEVLNNTGLQSKIKEENILQFEKENDCTEVYTLTKQYGQGWYKAGIVELIHNGPQRAFVRNEDIAKIKKYCEENELTQSSIKEKAIRDYVKEIYSEKVIENSRRIIKPLELDVFIPGINLAIEFNGTYWHSVEGGTAKEYHLKKSLMCRELGIRLIHIYEFEDFDKQLSLLGELIKGNDLYNKNDFNKNNLIEKIPEPEIVYVGNYVVYGAGKLYR